MNGSGGYILQKIWIRSKRSSDAELLAGRKQMELCTSYI